LAETCIPVPDYVAFDLETTGLSPEKDEILEVALVKFRDGRVVERWSSLVKPERPCPLKPLRLTHISREDLAQSPRLSDVLSDIQRFREKLPLVGHNSGFDASFLTKALPGFPDVALFDTLELSRIVFPGFQSYKLGDLAKNLGISLNDAHRAYDDAEASGILFRVVQETIREMPERIRETIVLVMKRGWSGSKLFERIRKGDETEELSLFNEPGKTKFSLPLLVTRVPAVSRTLALVPSLGSSQEPRESSSRYRNLLALLTERGPAEVLVGIPGTADAAREVIRASLEVASREDQSILLAGFPLALNEMPPETAYVGSPGEYLCILKLREVLELAERGFLDGLEEDDRRFLASLVSWVDLSEDGHSSQVQIAGNSYSVWRELASPLGPSCEDSCPFATECYYLKASRRSKSKRVHFTSKSSLLLLEGAYDKALVWGFHDLPGLVQHMEPRIDLARIRDTLEKTGFSGEAQRVTGLIEKAWNYLQRSRGEAICNEDLAREAEGLQALLLKAASKLRARLKAVYVPFSQIPLPDMDPPLLSTDLHKLEYWATTSEGFLTEDAERVRLVETAFGEDGSRVPVLSSRAIWPGLKAKEKAGQKAHQVFLFSYFADVIARRPGLRRFYGLGNGCLKAPALEGPRGKAEMVPVGNEILTAVVDKFPVPDASNYKDYVADFTCRLALRVPRILSFFSSSSFLKEVYFAISPILEERGIAVFAQGIDGGSRVTDQLEEDSTVVLAKFGAGPLEEIPGSALCVLIPKVPFSPPSILDDLRRKEVSREGHDGFIEVNVGQAVATVSMVFQALAKTGKRVSVIFLDPRLLPARSAWGKDFLAEFTSQNKVVAFEEDVISEVQKWIRRER